MTFDIDNLPVIRPTSAEDLGDAVRRAAAAGQAVYPFGGKTTWDYGLPPARPGVGIDIRGLSGVIDYPARDMTITVRAGTTIAELQALLRTENQQLPIDVPAADRATLGGVLATNTSGPRRLGYGTLRDYVLGISVVNDEGKETKAGGRVVKNVAGYDLCKLYVGSLGTLGVITQATLKLKPRPEAEALLSVSTPESGLSDLLDRVHGSQTRPVSVELLNGAATRALNQRLGRPLLHEGWTVLVGYEENADAVKWQSEQLLRELSAGQGGGTLPPDDAGAVGQSLVEFPLWVGSALTFKANLRPGAVAPFCRQAAAASERILLQAHAENGIVTGHLTGEWDLGPVRELTAAFRAAAVAADGNLIILRCPGEWKPALPVWGEPRVDRWLTKRVKQQLDPRGVFSPGRFGEF